MLWEIHGAGSGVGQMQNLCSPQLHNSSAVTHNADLWKTGNLVKSFEKPPNQRVEIAVLFSQVVNLPD
jgi:hypothetical protein